MKQANKIILSQLVHRELFSEMCTYVARAEIPRCWFVWAFQRLRMERYSADLRACFTHQEVGVLFRLLPPSGRKNR